MLHVTHVPFLPLFGYCSLCRDVDERVDNQRGEDAYFQMLVEEVPLIELDESRPGVLMLPRDAVGVSQDVVDGEVLVPDGALAHQVARDEYVLVQSAVGKRRDWKAADSL